MKKSEVVAMIDEFYAAEHNGEHFPGWAFDLVELLLEKGFAPPETRFRLSLSEARSWGAVVYVDDKGPYIHRRDWEPEDV